MHCIRCCGSSPHFNGTNTRFLSWWDSDKWDLTRIKLWYLSQKMTGKASAERLSVLHQNSGGIGKSIPSALQISLDPRDFPRASPSGNLSGLGKSFGRRGWISQYLPRLGGARIQCRFHWHTIFCTIYVWADNVGLKNIEFFCDKFGMLILQQYSGNYHAHKYLQVYFHIIMICKYCIVFMDQSICHHQQGRIDFNTVNPSLSTGKDFLIHSL